MNKENIRKNDLNETLKLEMAKAQKIFEKSEAILLKENLFLSYENDDLEYLNELLEKAKKYNLKEWINEKMETYEKVENPDRKCKNDKLDKMMMCGVCKCLKIFGSKGHLKNHYEIEHPDALYEVDFPNKECEDADYTSTLELVND
jgi:hypothetical protein